MKCRECGEAIDMEESVTCSNCGFDNSDGTQTEADKMSVAEDKMDAMVQAASVPNLAALFKNAKDKGLIQPAQEYVSTN